MTTPSCPGPEQERGESGRRQRASAAEPRPGLSLTGERSLTAEGKHGSSSSGLRKQRAQRRRQWRLGRWLWQALALLVVSHNLTVIHTTQFAPERLLSTLLAWGGALLCLEDRLPRLRPKPDWVGLVLGSLLLAFCLGRSAQLLVRDGLIYLLVPLEGLALAWLVLPRRRLGELWAPLLVLAALPASILLFGVLPEQELSRLSARLGQLLLLLLGQPALVDGTTLLLQGGSAVRVAGGCSGGVQLVQVGLVTLILLLAFPLRRWTHRLLMLGLPPVMTLLCNAMRVALLAWLNNLPPSQGAFWFQFLHEQAGALLIGGVAMTLTVMLHVALVERELRPLELAAATAAARAGDRPRGRSANATAPGEGAENTELLTGRRHDDPASEALPSPPSGPRPIGPGEGRTEESSR
ncbi:MAG: exosortase/archaeosortase family protein [Synechococcaceae cyanobacterium]|nr:exosortase/archaeosortase family protein [Synechococcaceae cyanobacterium]